MVSFAYAILEHAETEKRRKEEAERKAKLDEIAEKQRQRERELDEKERLRKEALLLRSSDGASKPFEPPVRALEPGSTAPAAAAAAATAGKYVPRHLRGKIEGAGGGADGQSPPRQSEERWGGGTRPELDSARWGPSRRTEGSSQAPPEADRWGRPDDRSGPPSDRWRPGGGSRSSSTWSSSRPPR